MISIAITGLAAMCIVALAAIVVPFRPFRTRLRAATSAVAVFLTMMALALADGVKRTQTAIAVPSDTRARYTAVKIEPAPSGALILTQRDGPSGRSFVHRECTCPVGQYRVLGEGLTADAARIARDPIETMTPLVREGNLGSVSFHVCEFACKAIASSTD